MINLLSTERKQELRAARTNVILSRYIAIMVISIIFIMGVLYVSYTLLQQTMASTEERIASSEVKAGVYTETKKAVSELSLQLSEARNVLGQQTSYAALLTKLGQAMPEGTILSNVTIDEAAIVNSTPVELTAYAKTEQDAATIQQRLTTSPIFAIVELKGTNASEGIAEYPVKVSLSVTFRKASI